MCVCLCSVCVCACMHARVYVRVSASGERVTTRGAFCSLPLTDTTTTTPCRPAAGNRTKLFEVVNGPGEGMNGVCVGGGPGW